MIPEYFCPERNNHNKEEQITSYLSEFRRSQLYPVSNFTCSNLQDHNCSKPKMCYKRQGLMTNGSRFLKLSHFFQIYRNIQRTISAISSYFTSLPLKGRSAILFIPENRRSNVVKRSRNIMIPILFAALAFGIGVPLPYIAGSLVPFAMKTFGVIQPGVGTLHAAGGVASGLQYLSSFAPF